jgi:ATP-dependent Lon protease
MTGSLGDVMKESARAALSYIRSISRELGLTHEMISSRDIHVHVPAGAIPKDGPSAGIAITAALVSALTGVAPRADLAMTGEVTLTGRVLPIGGLKEKLLAAKRAQVKRVIIPERNMLDVEDIPSYVTKKLEIIPVGDVDKVLKEAFPRGSLKKKRRSPAAKRQGTAKGTGK